MQKNDKGPNDLEQLLEQRQEQIDMLTKQKEYMQKKCREAAKAVLEQESRYVSLEKEYDKVCEERDNITTMLKSNDDVR